MRALRRYSLILQILIILLIGTRSLLPELKNGVHFYFLIFGAIVLLSLLAGTKRSFFYILFGLMVYINIFILGGFVADLINPGDGWVKDSSGILHRVMNLNWIWGVLFGLILAPLSANWYRKKAVTHRYIELACTVCFIIMVALEYTP